MASFFDKVTVKTPSGKKSKLNLDCQHLTTGDFFQLNCAYYRELVPNEHIKVNMLSQARLAPMVVPAYMNVSLKQRAFFVPFRTIFAGWNDFITDTVHVCSNNSSGLITHVPTILNAYFVALFKNVLYSVQDTASDPQDRVHDFVVYSGSSSPYTTSYYNFTARGRQLFKILTSLGYRINWNDTLPYTDKMVSYSALPLLAYCRVFVDWYWPAQYYNDTDRVNIEKILRLDNNTSPTLSSADLFTLCTWIDRLPYDPDYFTSAFDTPVGPPLGSFTSAEIIDITNSRSVLNQVGSVGAVRTNSGPYSTYVPNNGTPVAGLAFGLGSSNPPQITDYLLHALHRLNDYMKRHQLVGARAVDRFLARFGVTHTDPWRSIYLGSHSVPIQISDVMSNAQTSSDSHTESYDDSDNPTGYNDTTSVGGVLGEYAGKGTCDPDKFFSFDFECKEFGCLIVMTSIIPRSSLVQGVRRWVKHINKLDFFTPEFDALGNRAITSDEVYIPEEGFLQDTETVQDTVFGFTPQYSEYKCAFDTLSGDFQCNSLSQVGFTSDAWHGFRLFRPSNNWNAEVHSKAFVTALDSAQYTRCFYDYVGGNEGSNRAPRSDHFVINHLFNIESYVPMRALYDTYDWEDEGKELLVDVNGKTLN